jgi:hypothetical protein
MPHLTKRIVESAAPSDKPAYLWDDQLAGFGVKILPTGRREIQTPDGRKVEIEYDARTGAELVREVKSRKGKKED